ncbi:MAG TPA: hydrogenase nickel incorporation protein HypB [Geobacterales bacterium]|nr:hydrogenase nickel incorporation protein HypB [Geobacterales bacterium]
MCTDCGCSDPHHHHDDHHHHHHKPQPSATVAVEQDILSRNDRLAAMNRALFASHGILTLNLMSSPGSGKTTLLERTLRDLSGQQRFAVIEGDQQTDNDARRIAATGVPVRQINTGAGCHLDAHMVLHALEEFNLQQLDTILIENVGNLVCPASFDLGEQGKVVILSVTEGEDKPLKYPQMFRAASLLIITKIDLLPHLEFDLQGCREMARRVNPDITILELSSRTGQGMPAWYDWLKSQGARCQQVPAAP